MQPIKLVEELETIYDLLDQDEFNQKNAEERSRKLQTEFEEKEKQIDRKYDQERKPHEDVFEVEKEKLQNRLKSHRSNILKKPLNMTLIVISVSMMFVSSNELLQFTVPIFTVLFIAINFFIARRNIPLIEEALKELEEEFESLIKIIDDKRVSDLSTLKKQYQQKNDELSLWTKEEEKIKEQIGSNNLVGDYFKNKNKIRAFIHLLSEGRATTIEECIRISEFDDRELIIREKEQQLEKMEEQLTSFQNNLQKKERHLLEGEKVLEVREKTLNFNQSLLDHLASNISRVKNLTSDLTNVMSRFETLNKKLQEIDEGLINRVEVMDNRLEKMEAFILPRKFEEIQINLDSIDGNVKRHFEDLNRGMEEGFEQLDYSIERKILNITG